MRKSEHRECYRRAICILGLLVAISSAHPAWAQPGEDDPAGDEQAVALPAMEPRELTVWVERIAANADHLVVDLALEHLLDPATEEVLERGIPVTLVWEVEVWRERSAWFDRLEAVSSVTCKLQRDAWDEVYVLRESGGREEIFVDLVEARSAIERRAAVSIAPLNLLTEDDAYYLVVNAALKPLTVEDVDELEGWLSGEIKSGRQHGFGILGLPKALFGLLKNVTGLGDRNDTLRTPSFRRGEVTAAGAVSTP
jgi:hypothetical protein